MCRTIKQEGSGNPLLRLKQEPGNHSSQDCDATTNESSSSSTTAASTSNSTALIPSGGLSSAIICK